MVLSCYRSSASPLIIANVLLPEWPAHLLTRVVSPRRHGRSQTVSKLSVPWMRFIDTIGRSNRIY